MAIKKNSLILIVCTVLLIGCEEKESLSGGELSPQNSSFDQQPSK